MRRESVDTHDDIPLAPYRRTVVKLGMKFSNSLKFNAVSEWWDHYIAYDHLKKQVYQLEKEHQRANTGYPRYRDLEAAPEEAALLSGSGRLDERFRPSLDHELKKITTFYEKQENDVFGRLSAMEEEIRYRESQGLRPEEAYLSPDSEPDEDEDHLDDRLSPTVDSPSRTTRIRPRSFASSSRENPARHTARSQERRYSTSSSEDGGELEASLLSLPSNLPPVFEVEHTDSTTRPPEPATYHSNRSHKQSRSRPRLSQVFASITSNTNDTAVTVWTAKNSYAFDTRALFKRKLVDLFISLTSLRSYVELNYSGFSKILKKFDKHTYSELKQSYMQDVVEKAYPFLPATRAKLKEAIGQTVSLYAKCVTKNDISVANKQLRVHQREQIAWERDTVWRQMIDAERRGRAENDDDTDNEGNQAIRPSTHNFVFETPLGTIRFRKKKIFVLVGLAVFIFLLKYSVVSEVEANNCFAILVFATILWASEAIPLFVTALLIPPLLVMFRTIRSTDAPYTRLPTKDAAKFIFAAMFSPTIMLLIGGFTIAAAVSKTGIDKILVTRVLSLAGTRPNVVILTFMAVSCFMSMWISNVAAPTLCFTLIQPILRTLPSKTTFAPCLILGIALAANIGGQTSPISSPQNVIAFGQMDPPISWLQWFAVALPVSFISIIIIWLLLLVSYRPGSTADGEPLEIRPIRYSKEALNVKQWWVLFVCFTTIALWCVEYKIENVVGDMGVIAILPIVAFFGTGVLKKSDFEQFLWTIVFLAMGGISLGKGVESSGLLAVTDGIVRDAIKGLSLNEVVFVLSGIVLVISTFISHTVASVLLVPIAKQIGDQLSGQPHPRLLIFLTGLICSTGMAMPVSGFPNQTAANQVNELGDLYLSNIDFLKNGIPASILATLVVSTVGYLLMRAIGL